MKVEVRMNSDAVEGAFGFGVEILVREAASEMEALSLTRRTMEMLAKGRRTFIRCYPESNSQRNFDTKITEHKGYARFIVLDQEGEWEGLLSHEVPPLGKA